MTKLSSSSAYAESGMRNRGGAAEHEASTAKYVTAPDGLRCVAERAASPLAASNPERYVVPPLGVDDLGGPGSERLRLVEAAQQRERPCRGVRDRSDGALRCRATLHPQGCELQRPPPGVEAATPGLSRIPQLAPDSNPSHRGGAVTGQIKRPAGLFDPSRRGRFDDRGCRRQVPIRPADGATGIGGGSVRSGEEPRAPRPGATRPPRPARCDGTEPLLATARQFAPIAARAS